MMRLCANAIEVEPAAEPAVVVVVAGTTWRAYTRPSVWGSLATKPKIGAPNATSHMVVSRSRSVPPQARDIAGGPWGPHTPHRGARPQVIGCLQIVSSSSIRFGQ